MPRLAVESWEIEHKKHIAEYLAQIDELYEMATDEVVRLGLSYTYDPTSGKPFYFRSDKTRNQAVNVALSNFRENIVGIVSAGIASEWAFANEKTDSWVYKLFSDPKKGYMLHNLEAMEAYIHRKTYGHTLSERVWNYTAQFKEQVELSLSVGLSEGRSAAQISRDVRIHLNEPDKLFRRVRNKFGDLVLSKSARAYNPGQGVYRSSYQNAMRMARTEINGAYREADYIRWQQLDFIVGIEVKVSKSHIAWLAKEWYPRFKKGAAPQEICDQMAGRYPKDFKFIGWHPNCRCYAVPIIANEGTDADWWEEPQNEVTTTPKGFKDWVKKNKERILKAEKDGKLPYFLSENKGYTNLRPEKTAAQKQAIIDRWEARKVEYKKATNLASNVLKAAKQYPEVDVDKLQALYDAYRIKDMRTEAKKVANKILAVKQDEQFLSALIPDVKMWKQQFSSAELHDVYDAVEKSLTTIDNKPLDMLKYNNILEQKKALISKEMLYVSDPDYLKPHTLYPTWEVSQAAYNKQLGIILDQIDWGKIENALQSAITFKTKSKPYLDLVDDLNVAVYKKDKTTAQKIITQIEAKQDALKKAAESRARRKSGGAFDNDAYSQERKDAALWSNKRSADGLFDKQTGDDYFRPFAERDWKKWDANQKDVAYLYTSGSSYINEPLYTKYYSTKYGLKGEVRDSWADINTLTEMIDNSTPFTRDVWLNRGASIGEFFGQFGEDLYSYINNPGALIGKVGEQKAFLSTAHSKSWGFVDDGNAATRNVVYNIYCPKGTKGIYTEPYSAFGSGSRKWDGKSVTPLRNELEVILQRSTRLRVIKAEYKRGQWFIDMEVIGQPTF